MMIDLTYYSILERFILIKQLIDFVRQHAFYKAEMGSFLSRLYQCETIKVGSYLYRNIPLNYEKSNYFLPACKTSQ